VLVKTHDEKRCQYVRRDHDSALYFSTTSGQISRNPCSCPGPRSRGTFRGFALAVIGQPLLTRTALHLSGCKAGSRVLPETRAKKHSERLISLLQPPYWQRSGYQSIVTEYLPHVWRIRAVSYSYLDLAWYHSHIDTFRLQP
jgi:hypothetical protein